jgi:hypothetical protein
LKPHPTKFTSKKRVGKLIGKTPEHSQSANRSEWEGRVGDFLQKGTFFLLLTKSLLFVLPTWLPTGFRKRSWKVNRRPSRRRVGKLWATLLLSETAYWATLALLAASPHIKWSRSRPIGSRTKAYILWISSDIFREFTQWLHGIPNFSSGSILKWQKRVSGPPRQIVRSGLSWTSQCIPNH